MLFNLLVSIFYFQLILTMLTLIFLALQMYKPLLNLTPGTPCPNIHIYHSPKISRICRNVIIYCHFVSHLLHILPKRLVLLTPSQTQFLGRFHSHEPKLHAHDTWNPVSQVVLRLVDSQVRDGRVFLFSAFYLFQILGSRCSWRRWLCSGSLGHFPTLIA